MSKIKYLLFLCAMICMYSNAESKVCFILEECDTPTFSGCPDCYACDVPRKNILPCSCSTDVPLYAQGDCCSDGSHQTCESPKVCDNSGECASVTNKNGTKTSYCNGNCVCPSTYKKCESPLIGVGTACTDADGDKYKECKCPSDYKLCKGANQVGTGSKCTDSEGTKYTKCSCPTGWSSNDFCCGTLSKCTDDTGANYYNCSSVATPSCKCQYTYTGGCVSGCDDSKYDYIGTVLSNVQYQTKIDGMIDNTICATGLCCKKGYWDKEEHCKPDSDTYCKNLGYTSGVSSCSGDIVACPCNTSMKKCIQVK